MKKAFPEHSKMNEEKAVFKVCSEPLIPGKDSVELHASIPTELPPFYGTNTIFLIAQDPHWLFTYWDMDTLSHPEKSTFLRCIQANGSLESEVEVPFERRNSYIPVSQSGIGYLVELGYYQENQWNCIAQSSTVQTPSHQVSSSDSLDYATSPSLSCQQLLRHFQNTIRSNETLICALARLQKEGKLLQLAPSNLSDLAEDERIIFEFLLGKEFLTSYFSSSLNSTQLQEKIQEHLEKKLRSLSTHEILVPSPDKNEKDSFIPPLTAFLNNSLSCWNTEMLSSWTSGALSQSQASETSSWENTEQNTEGYDFFLNVHAEVNFYGTTHPGSSVTIDGKPVSIHRDGSFYYHFSFPDEAYEIPIVSKAPDGLETRAAVLRFHRTPSSKSSPPSPIASSPPNKGDSHS